MPGIQAKPPFQGTSLMDLWEWINAPSEGSYQMGRLGSGVGPNMTFEEFVQQYQNTTKRNRQSQYGDLPVYNRGQGPDRPQPFPNPIPNDPQGPVPPPSGTPSARRFNRAAPRERRQISNRINARGGNKGYY